MRYPLLAHALNHDNISSFFVHLRLRPQSHDVIGAVCMHVHSSMYVNYITVIIIDRNA